MTQTRIPGTERHFRISTPDLRLLGVTRSQIHEWARNRGDREAIIQAPKVSRHTRGARAGPFVGSVPKVGHYPFVASTGTKGQS